METTRIFDPTVETSLLEWHRQSGKVIFKIKPDGSVVLDDGVSLDEAATAFWDAVEQMAPLARSLSRPGA